MDFNEEIMQVGVFSEEEAELLSGTVQTHSVEIQNIANSANTLNDKIDSVSGELKTAMDLMADEVDDLADGLAALSGDVSEIVGGDFLTREELEAMDYLTESGAAQTYQPITQFRTVNGSAITGDNSDIEVSYDDTEIKADIQSLSADVQTIVDGDFVVTFTKNNNVYSADKTIEEVNAAADAGKRVIAKLYTYPSWHAIFYLTYRRTGNGAYAIYVSEASTISTGYNPHLIDKGVWYILQTNDGITDYVNYFEDYAKLEDVSGFTNDIQSISAQVQTISGDYLTQEDLTPYATTAFTESTYLKEVPSNITDNIQVISGQVESLGNTVVSNSQNIQSLSGKVNTISGQVESVSGDVETLQNTPFVQEGDDISVLINDAGYLLPSSLKTINKMSLIGNGDITIGTGETYDDTAINQRVDVVSGDVQTLSGQIQTISGAIPTNLSDLTNDAGYLTKSSADTLYATQADLASVSGSLDDYLTESAASQTYQLKTQFRTINGSAITGDNTNIVISVPTSTSALTNDSGFLTSSDFKTINNSPIVGSGDIVVPTIWIGSQQDYDALPSYDNNTLYCIEKEN